MECVIPISVSNRALPECSEAKKSSHIFRAVERFNLILDFEHTLA